MPEIQKYYWEAGTKQEYLKFGKIDFYSILFCIIP